MNATFIRWIIAVCLSSLVADRGLAAEERGERQRRAPKRSLGEVIVDKADFLSRLPKKTLVSPLGGRPKSPEIAETGKRNLEKALAELGDPGDREFVLLPESATHPEVVQMVAPTYPTGFREDGVMGDALFLVLVNAEGKVAAIYCPVYTHRRFATHGATAIARWTYTPAKIGDRPLPALIAQPIFFTLSE